MTAIIYLVMVVMQKCRRRRIEYDDCYYLEHHYGEMIPRHNEFEISCMTSEPPRKGDLELNHTIFDSHSDLNSQLTRQSESGKSAFTQQGLPTKLIYHDSIRNPPSATNMT